MPQSIADTPFGLCHCGCGRKTNIAKYTDKRDGIVKGRPYRYLKGHAGAIHYTDADIVTDPETGCMVRPGARTRNDGAGYVKRRIRGRYIYAHVAAWEAVNGPVPTGFMLDHTCRNPPCENVGHLRLATPSQNQGNRARDHDSSSRFKGVSFAKKGKPWTAHIAGKWLGSFDSEEAAARAYDRAAWERWGEYALLNFPQEGEQAA